MDTTARDYRAEILAARKIVHNPRNALGSPEVEAAIALANQLDDEADEAGVRIDFSDIDEEARAYCYPGGKSWQLRFNR